MEMVVGKKMSDKFIVETLVEGNKSYQCDNCGYCEQHGMCYKDE